MVRLYHGTSGDRLEAIKTQGLIPRPKDEFLYATTDPMAAEFYAYIRAVQRAGMGVVVEFEVEDNGWEIDTGFPESYKVNRAIPPSRITRILTVTVRRPFTYSTRGDWPSQSTTTRASLS